MPNDPMHTVKRIALILTDTLQCIGLHTLLTDYFTPVEIATYSSFAACKCIGTDFDCYITQADLFVVYADFFLPRRAKTWVLTNSSDSNDAASGINCLCTTDSIENLLEQLRQLFEQETTSNEANKGLSQREIDVLQLVATGITNKEIADKLNISLNTVLSHRKNITSKLGIKTVSGLTFYAIMNGIIAGNEIE